MLNRAGRYYQIAKSILNDTVTQITHLMLRDKHPDFHFGLDSRIATELEKAYQEGRKDGRAEVTEEVILFDETKDKVNS